MPPTSVTHADLMAEVLALRPEIERILASDGRHRDPSSIEDNVQTVLLHIWRHLDNYEPHADGMTPWVSRIAYNAKLDSHRAKKRQLAAFGHQQSDMEEIQLVGPCPERRARARALLRRVLPLIMEMPAPLRTVLVLNAFECLDAEQIAKRLDISYGNARMRLSRAHAYLRDRVGSLDEHCSFLAPAPILDAPTNGGFAPWGLMMANQMAHLLPAVVAGVLVLGQLEQPPIPKSIPVEASKAAFTGPTLPTSVNTLVLTKLRDAPSTGQTLSHQVATRRAKLVPPIRIDLELPGKTLWWRKTR